MLQLYMIPLSFKVYLYYTFCNETIAIFGRCTVNTTFDEFKTNYYQFMPCLLFFICSIQRLTMR